MFQGISFRTQKAYIEQYRENIDVFFGIEHRMKRKEMEEQFNEESKQGWRVCS